ncbi:MAG: hypothetical protein ACI9W4_001432 [Rhodothermales bacterium]|jgi:hypothetical protein
MRSPLFLSTLVLTALFAAAGCDHGLEPPERAADGSIIGTVTYRGTWPPQSQFHDLRFVAMRFVPQDTLDFLQLNRMAISSTLAHGVTVDSFTISAVAPGVFLYSGIAQQQTSELLSWRPVGLFEDNAGLFSVEPGGETRIDLTVDFENLPVFPPEDL